MTEELPETKAAEAAEAAVQALTVEELTDALAAGWDNPLRDPRDRRLPRIAGRPGWSSSGSPVTCPARS